MNKNKDLTSEERVKKTREDIEEAKQAEEETERKIKENQRRRKNQGRYPLCLLSSIIFSMKGEV